MFDEANETMDVERLRELQTVRLRALVGRFLSSSERHRYSAEGLTSSADVDLDSLQHLPFTTKSDIVARYPTGGLMVDTHEVVEWHGSSGTGGHETLIPYSRKDIITWSGLCARLLAAAGVTGQSVVANAYSLGLFSGGMGYHYGLGRLGASVIPLGIGPMPRLVRLLLDMKVDTLACTPTYAARLAAHLADKGLDLQGMLGLRVGIFGAEPFGDEMRASLERGLGLRTFDLYGLSEASGPGVAGECQERSGLHINEDHFLLEVIDPETGQSCTDGIPGEIVLTTLTKQAGPILRYRTGDLASIARERCGCGRTLARTSRILGRLDDLILINGVNVYPRDIEEQILAASGLSGDFAILHLKNGGSDATIVLESDGGAIEDLYRLEGALATRLGVRVRVATLPRGSLQSGEVKQARRVIPADTPEASRILGLIGA